ncbi:MAG: 16S rRNA processing protein RimM [Pseudooceanicola sp.]|jgi:16S rRNA processing protein RimM|nr:16S rRNA processing protein RimM [Pseudooceanicola sp.]
MPDELICVGALAGAFGVRGEVRLKSFCAEPEAIGTYSPLCNEDGDRQFTVTLTRPIGNGFAARVSGIETKEQADALKGLKLFAPRDRLPSLPDDEFYYTDLVGLPVSDTGGRVLGTVIAVQNHGAGDLLEIRPDGRETVLLPFTRENVPTVDLSKRAIVADPPEGLFE